MRNRFLFGRAAVLAVVVAAGAAVVRAVTLGELLDGPPVGEAVVYRTVGDRALKLHIWRPAGTDVPASGPRAAVLWIHGGGWTGGSPEMFFPHARYCATRGAVGVVVEYRLVQPGRTSVEDSMADCRAALRHLREHAGEWDIDAGRIAVAGDSSGGHLAAALAVLPEAGQGGEDQAAMTSARPDALMLFCPVLDLERVTWLKPATLGEGPAGVAFAERRRALSPGRHVRAGLPPALLLHGRDDPTVPWEGSRDFAAAWVEAGSACDFEVLEGTRHAFVLTRWRTPEAQVVAALRRADTFLAGQGFLAGEATLTESSPPAW